MWFRCYERFVMPSGSPASVSGGVTSSHHHHHHRHHLAATVTSSISSSGSMSGTSLPGHQQLLSRTNLYIRGLKPETTDKDLVTLCQQYILAYFAFI